MKALKLFFLATIAILFSLTACQKDDDNGSELAGTYSFQTISDNNTIYAYKRENGNAIEIPEAERDMSILDECNQVHIIDNIEIISGNSLSYTAYEIWSDTDETRTETSDYIIDGDQLVFTFTDEFGNEEEMKLRIEATQLVLTAWVFADKWGPGFQPLDIMYREPTLLLSGQNAIDRLGADEGNEVYMMIYEQRYE